MVNAWKAVLAALVIFSAGVVTGALTLKAKSNPAPSPVLPFGGFGIRSQRPDFVDHLQRELYLSAAQRDRIEQILRESHDRMKRLWDQVAPEAREEHREGVAHDVAGFQAEDG